MRGGSKIGWGIEWIRLWNAWTELSSLFSLTDFATPSHFQIRFSPIFWALQPSRDNQRDHKDQHLNPERGIFWKMFCQKFAWCPYDVIFFSILRRTFGTSYNVTLKGEWPYRFSERFFRNSRTYFTAILPRFLVECSFRVHSHTPNQKVSGLNQVGVQLQVFESV